MHQPVLDYYGVIYKITNIQNKKCYIGQTIKDNYMSYIKKHFTNALSYKRNKYFYSAIKHYGEQNFKIQILGFCYSEEELDESEIESIYFFRSLGSNGKDFDHIYGYNMTLGGEGTVGYFYSDELRAYLSKQGKASYKNNPERAKKLGITLSNLYNIKPELRKQKSIISKQTQSSPEYRNKMSEIQKQYYKDHPERKIKIGKASKAAWTEERKLQHGAMTKARYENNPEIRTSESKRMSGKNNPAYVDVDTAKILQLKSEGKFGPEIAKLLNIKQSTVYTRLKNPQKYL